MPDVRPVWLTRAQRDKLLTIWQHDEDFIIPVLVDAWDAAPSDAVGVLAVAQYRRRWPDDQDLKQHGDGRAWRAAARAHLALLGMPHE